MKRNPTPVFGLVFSCLLLGAAAEAQKFEIAGHRPCADNDEQGDARYLRTAVTMRLSESRKSCRFAGGKLARSRESAATAPGASYSSPCGSLTAGRSDYSDRGSCPPYSS